MTTKIDWSEDSQSPTSHPNKPSCTPGIEPDSNGYVPPNTCGYVGKPYYPSFYMAVAFTVLTGICFLGHAFQVYRFPRSRIQRVPPFISAFLSTGYIARTIGTRHMQDVYLAIWSDTVILLSPILITAFNSLLLFKLADLCPSGKPKWAFPMRALFPSMTISIWILAFVQLITCAMIITGNPSEIQVWGIRTYIGTLAFQQILLLGLLGLAFKLHSTLSTTKDLEPLGFTNPQVRVTMFAIYFNLSAISVRTVYRVIELFQVFQPGSLLPHKEMFFYVFETAPVLAAIFVWAFVSIGYLSQVDSRKEDCQYQEVADLTEEHVPLTVTVREGG